MTTQAHHDMGVHILDIVSTLGGLFAVASRFADLVHPIVSGLVGVATLGWWALRYVEWWRFGRKRHADAAAAMMASAEVVADDDA